MASPAFNTVFAEITAKKEAKMFTATIPFNPVFTTSHENACPQPIRGLGAQLALGHTAPM